MSRIIAIAIIMTTILGGLFFYGAQQMDKTEQENVDVIATIFPIYDITRNIAGDQLNVTLLLRPGASPHTFEPSPRDLRNVQKASVMYGVGHGLDDWAFEIAEEATPVKTVDQNINTKIGEENNGEQTPENEKHEESDVHEDDETNKHTHGATDPHYWLSISNGKQIAQNITNDLKQRFPEHADAFDQNLAEYLTKLDRTDGNIRRIINEGVENKNLITLHDAWYYFSNEYDLEIVGTFEPSAGREPTPQYLIRLTRALNEARVTTIYSEPQIPTDSLDSFISDNNLNIADLDPLGGVKNRQSYIEMMQYNAQTIADNQ